MKRKIPLLILCLLFLGFTCYSGYRAYLEMQEYKAGEAVYDQLAQYAHIAETAAPTEPKPAEVQPEQTLPPETEAPPEADTPSQPVVEFEALRDINPEIVGWIYVEGTGINYPVVQSGDNSYYLYRLFNGESNGAGSIFMDYRNASGLTDRHTVLYGHHMKNGSMFAAITDYKEQAFYEEHPTGILLTPGGNYTLEFFAGYVSNLNDDCWKLQFESDAEFAAWAEDAVDKSTFESPVVPTARDRIVTLSTCTYEYNDARYVLLGVLRSDENNAAE